MRDNPRQFDNGNQRAIGNTARSTHPNALARLALFLRANNVNNGQQPPTILSLEAFLRAPPRVRISGRTPSEWVALFCANPATRSDPIAINPALRQLGILLQITPGW